MREELKDLLEAVETAIASGDWKVDGACDPDAVIQRARNVLVQSAPLTYAGNGTTGFLEGERPNGFFLQIPSQLLAAGLRKEVEMVGKHSADYEEGFWDALEKYESLIRTRGQA